MPPERLRDRVVAAGHIQASYLLWRLGCVRDLPWSLCSGDRRANLQALAARPRPEDEGCNAKIWELLQIGCDEQVLLDGLELLSKVSFSSKRVEEGHVQGSKLMQLHRRLGEAGMLVRAQIGQVRPLIARSPTEMRLAKVEEQIDKLSRKNPEKLGAKQAYMGKMIAMARGKRLRSSAGPGSVTRHCVANHGRMWAELAPEVKAAWHERAVQQRVCAKRKLEADVHAAQAKRRAILEEARETEEGPLSLTKIRVSSDELERFDDM